MLSGRVVGSLADLDPDHPGMFKSMYFPDQFTNRTGGSKIILKYAGKDATYALQRTRHLVER